MESVSYKITEGNEYLWNCFGPDSYQIDSGSSYGANTVSVIFDNKTQVVYEMEAWDNANRRTYRWIHPDYIDEVKAEYKKRNLRFEISVDDEKFIDLDVEEDMLRKAKAISEGEEYDTRIDVILDLPEDLVNQMFRLAHKMDLTLNKFVEYILIKELERLKNE